MNAFVFAARPLLADFLSTLVFVILMALHVDVVVAIAAATALGAGQVIYLKLRGRPVASLQWLSLGLVLVSGAASLLTHDPRFVMAKPSVIYLLVAWAMLERGWMLRFVPPVARGHVEDVMIGFGYVWAGLMVFSAAANLAVAVFWTPQWTLFVSVFPLASKAALFLVQFAVVRAHAKRRIRAAQAPAGLEAASA
jgi:intracellular septation protein A